MPDLDRLRERVADADRLLHGIATHTERLTMRIPADPKRDADLIIGDLADGVTELLDRLEAAEAERDYWKGQAEGFFHRLLAEVESLADEWANADGEPVTGAGLTALTTVNRNGRKLREVIERHRGGGK